MPLLQGFFVLRLVKRAYCCGAEVMQLLDERIFGHTDMIAQDCLRRGLYYDRLYYKAYLPDLMPGLKYESGVDDKTQLA